MINNAGTSKHSQQHVTWLF